MMRVRKRWLALGVLAIVIVGNVAVYAHGAFQRAGYRAELAALPVTPCVEALTSEPLSELHIYIGGGYNRTFPGTRSAELLQVLNGLGCTETEIITYFFQYPVELTVMEMDYSEERYRYIIEYRDFHTVSIINRIAFYLGIIKYYFFLYFYKDNNTFMYLTMWPE